MTRAIIGIDLGTTTSAVAVAGDGRVEVLGDGVRPSVVTFGDGELAVGHRAVELARTHPESSFRGVKRLLGRKIDGAGVLRLARTAPYAVAAAPNRDAWLRVGGRPTPPQQIAAEILAAMRRDAEDHLGAPVTRAVVAVPAYFDDAQRQATRDAGTIAGLEIVRLINEPTAAALAYGIGGDEPTTAAVFDLGGGTFDVSILRITGGLFQVLATAGDGHLGGDDWDLRILEVLIDELFESRGVDATGWPAAIAALRDAAESAKIALSTASETAIELDIDLGEPVSVRRRIDRAELEALTADLCDQLAAPIRQALADAHLTAHDIDQVLPVGGMSRAPMIRERVARLLGEPIDAAIDPAGVVASGAAICAAVLAGDDGGAILLDVSSQSLGLRIGDVRYPGVIARGAELPAIARVRHPAPSSPLVVEVFRGEAEPVEANTRVGTVELDVSGQLGSPEAADIEIAADVDAMVRVSLCDGDGAVIRASTGRLRARAGLTDSQLERFVHSDLLSAVTRRSDNSGGKDSS